MLDAVITPNSRQYFIGRYAMLMPKRREKVWTLGQSYSERLRFLRDFVCPRFGRQMQTFAPQKAMSATVTGLCPRCCAHEDTIGVQPASPRPTYRCTAQITKHAFREFMPFPTANARNLETIFGTRITIETVSGSTLRFYRTPHYVAISQFGETTALRLGAALQDGVHWLSAAWGCDYDCQDGCNPESRLEHRPLHAKWKPNPNSDDLQRCRSAIPVGRPHQDGLRAIATWTG